MVDRKRHPDPGVTDQDNPEWTAEDFARARGPEALSDAELAAFPRTRGRPKAESPKEPVSMRLDADLVQYLRAKGPGWQTRVNDALHRLMDAGQL